MEVKILLAILVVVVIISVGTRLYKAKTNDGKISKDEILDILKNLINDAVDVYGELTEFKTLPVNAQRVYIGKQLAAKISSTNTLSEAQIDILNKNMDRIIEYVIDHAEDLSGKLNTSTITNITETKPEVK